LVSDLQRKKCNRVEVADVEWDVDQQHVLEEVQGFGETD
jgi:hypothetical protein